MPKEVRFADEARQRLAEPPARSASARRAFAKIVPGPQDEPLATVPPIRAHENP